MERNITKETILRTAIDIADTKGLANVSLKEIAQILGIKSPSIYKHMPGGLTQIKHEIMILGWREIDEVIARGTAGKAGDEAVMALCMAFRGYVNKHPGVFEALQWHNSYVSTENDEVTKGIIQTLYQIIDAYKVGEDEKLHILRMLCSFVEGYCVIENHGGFGNPVSLDESFDYAVCTIITGINSRRNKFS